MPPNKKIKMIGLLIAAAIIAIAAIFVFANKQPPSEKQSIADNMLQKIQAYKSSHQRYPASLEMIDPAPPYWLVYTSTPDGESFILSYSRNVLKPSMVFYESKNGVWKERFPNKIRE